MMTDYPCAKINLGLNVVGKRPDGYHNLETIFYPVRLCDKLEIVETSAASGFRLSVDGIGIEGDLNDNLVAKAYRLLKERHPLLPEVAMRLTKNIPSQAGMGGGSADCAYTITMLNKMFRLGMDVTEMQALAAKLGADCAFFVNPVPSFATGIGEKLTPIDLDLSRYVFGIVKPPVKISTKEAFANVTPKQPAKPCLDIVRQPVETWKDELVNDFEESVMPVHGEIADIKQRLYGLGAVYAAMSGSGSALFGIFRDKPENLAETFKDCFTAIV